MLSPAYLAGLLKRKGTEINQTPLNLYVYKHVSVLLINWFFVPAPGVVRIKGGHSRRRCRRLAEVFFIDHIFLIDDEGHNAR